MRTLLLILALVAASAPLVRAQPAAPQVDVALVLAVDVSLSMDRDEQRAQRDGYIAALRHPAFLSAVERGRLGKVALAYVEWGAPWDQRTLLDWAVIDGPETAGDFADALAETPFSTSRGTSISGAIDHAVALLERAPPALRRVVDISGDGPNNMGSPVLDARARAIAAGVEINGLPLMIKEYDAMFSIPDLDIYYERCVIAGPAAFVLPVTRVDQFTAAIRQKLILEVSQAVPGTPPPANDVFGVDCLIGERLYQRWRRSFSFD